MPRPLRSKKMFPIRLSHFDEAVVNYAVNLFPEYGNAADIFRAAVRFMLAQNPKFDASAFKEYLQREVRTNIDDVKQQRQFDASIQEFMNFLAGKTSSLSPMASQKQKGKGFRSSKSDFSSPFAVKTFSSSTDDF